MSVSFSTTSSEMEDSSERASQEHSGQSGTLRGRKLSALAASSSHSSEPLSLLHEAGVKPTEAASSEEVKPLDRELKWYARRVNTRSETINLFATMRGSAAFYDALDCNEATPEEKADKFRETLSLYKTQRHIKRTRTQSAAYTSDTLRKSWEDDVNLSPGSERAKALVRNRKQLRSIANALHAISSQTGAYSISWCGSEGLRLDEGVPKLKSKEPVFTKLLQTFREAQRHRLFFLHDDRGGIVRTKALCQKIALLARESPALLGVSSAAEILLIEKLVLAFEEKPHGIMLESKRYRAKIAALEFPEKRYGTSKASKKLCIRMLQRLYRADEEMAGEEGIKSLIGPLPFLMCYKRFFSTEELFEQMERVLRLKRKYFPDRQKLRVLDLLRLWISSGINHKECNAMEERLMLRKILKTAELTGIEGVSSYLMEIEEDLEQVPLLPMKEFPAPGQQGFSRMLAEVPALRGKGKRYKEIVETVAADLFKLSVFRVLNIAPYEFLLKSRDDGAEDPAHDVTEAIKYFNDIESCVRAAIFSPLQILEDIQLTEEFRKEKLKDALAYVRFFTDLAAELANRNDYLSSFAIYSAVNGSAVSRIAAEQGRKSGLLGKAKSVPDKKLQGLMELFSFSGNFRTLRQICREHADRQEPYIPCLLLLKRDVAPLDEALPYDDDKAPHGVNIRKLNALSNVLLPFVKAQNLLRSCLLSTGESMKPVTDLLLFLQVPQRISEGDCARLAALANPSLQGEKHGND